jgi:hypothetical protein
VHISAHSSFSFTSGGGKPSPGFTLTAIRVSASNCAVLSLAVESKPVRVNAVVLGTINTDLPGKYPAEVKEIFRSKTFVGALVKPEDAAEAYFYLIKDKFVTSNMVYTKGRAFWYKGNARAVEGEEGLLVKSVCTCVIERTG